MRSVYSYVVLFVVVLGIALPVAIKAIDAASAVRADIEARYDCIESVLATQ